MIKLGQYLGSEFAKNSVTMITGTAIAQSIPIIGSVFLARLYTPNMIGAFTSFVSLTSILSILATLKFEDAIILPKNEEDGKALFQLSVILNLFFFISLSIYIFFFKNFIVTIYPSLDSYILLIPLAVFFVGFYQSLSNFSIRNKKFRDVSISKVSQNISTISFQILLNQFTIIGLLFGRIIGFAISIFHFKCLFLYKSLFKVDISRVKTAFIRFKNFAFYNTPNSFLNQLSNFIPLFLLPLFFDLSYAGYYSFSTRIVLVPFGIITTSLQQVFYKEMTDRNNKGEDLELYLRYIYRRLFLLAFFPHVILFLCAPSLFTFLFGEEWRIAGLYTQYLLPWFFLVFLNSPISSIYIIKGKQKEYFFIEILLLFFRAASIWCGFFYFNNPAFSIIFYSLVGFIFNSFLIWYYIKISKYPTN
jgi:lipopolysaccharide exporter